MHQKYHNKYHQKSGNTYEENANQSSSATALSKRKEENLIFNEIFVCQPSSRIILDIQAEFYRFILKYF